MNSPSTLEELRRTSRRTFNLPEDIVEMLIELYTEQLHRYKKASYTAIVSDAIREYYRGRYEKESVCDKKNTSDQKEWLDL